MNPFQRIYQTIFSSPNKVQPSQHYLNKLFKVIGYYPLHDYTIYEAALTHSSYNHRMRSDNERLEYLGDAVLNLVIGEKLFLQYPSKDEGFLTKARSKMVSREHINAIAEALELTKYIHHTLDKKQIAQMPNLPGNSLEALIGAYFLDYGYVKTSEIVLHIMENFADWDERISQDKDFKSALYQYVQSRNLSIEFESAMITDKKGINYFESVVKIANEQKGKGRGNTKKSSEQSAAQDALQNLGV
jgi:ribonuclease-3